MTTYLLLLGISCGPALTGIALTSPLWFIRKISNDTIRISSVVLLFITLIGCYTSVFLDNTLEMGFLYFPLSLLNFLFFNYFEYWIYTTRCPRCRSLTLSIRRRSRNTYKLFCRRCSLSTHWKPWKFIPGEKE